jgi:inhibitor of KinA
LTTTSFAPLGDRGVTIRFGDGISAELSERVYRNSRAIADANIRGTTDVVPSYASLAVFYDPLAVSFEDLSEQLNGILADVEENPAGSAAETRVVRIPVRYDGEDLDEVARRTNLTREEVIELHAGREYRVFVVGFVPGFAYLGPLDQRLVVPRRESPRKRVPSGAVAIAETQTGIYPSATPGGWHLIGTTNERMFDAARVPPALLEVGHRVRFEPLA